MKHCGNCEYGKYYKTPEECNDCEFYNEETLNNNWKCENGCKN